jgi:N-acetylglucosamine-6-phosphate deacetylase
MMKRSAFAARRIFDGAVWHEDAALLVRAGSVEAIVPQRDVPAGISVDDCSDILAPGFVDLQVNGGGGVMVNDHPTVEGIDTICRAHARFGTTALLATLITDTRAVTAAAVNAGVAAAKNRVQGFAGLHLEGPHLSVARKGAHDPRLIRQMDGTDQAALIAARQALPTLLTTVAPESVTQKQVGALTGAGVVVSLGHSDCTFATAQAYADVGASMTTHLFNAMSQIGNREPGLAGAAIDSGSLWASIIADGIHVDSATMAIALRGKRGPARMLLVTDAMATIGTDMKSFMLNGREIHRRDGQLTLADGTLAGADLDMISAVRFVHRKLGLDLGEALRMASFYPAEAIGRADRLGRLGPNSAADFVALGDKLDIAGTWIGGNRVA